jgi:hypothetical protein
MSKTKRHPDGYSALRRQGSGSKGSLVLTVSQPIARVLMDAGQEGSLFRCELTDEGILFRRADSVTIDLPSWANGHES